MTNNKKNFGVKGSKSHHPQIRFEVIHGNVNYSPELIKKEIESFIVNLEKGATMEISTDDQGNWSPLDYFLRTIRPNFDIKELTPEGSEILTFLIGAGLDIEKRMNVFKIIVEELKKHAIEKIKKIDKTKDFNILKYIRGCFEEKIVGILQKSKKDPKK